MIELRQAPAFLPATWRFARPLGRPARAHLIALGVAIAAALLVAAERDVESLPFTFSCFAALVSLSFVLARRVVFSLCLAVSILGASALVSMAKFKHMSLNAHVIDIYFYLKKPDILLFLAHEFRAILIGFAGLLLVCTVLAVRLYRREAPSHWPRRMAAEIFLIAVFLAVITRPGEAGTIGYYVRKSHFVSALFASAGDAIRLGQESALKARLDELPPTQPFTSPSDACASGPRPDIVVVLSESAVAPAHIPEWRSSPAIREAFKSFDGQTHGLRVETYGGGTWVSEVQMLAGLSPADLDWRRPYATLFMENRVRHSLPQRLKDCGYRTVAISPLTYNFVNEGPFLRSIGVDEVLDYKAIGAASKHEPDEVYYKAALDVMAQHRPGDDRPVFIFVMTMTAHSPYDYRYEPGVRVAGEPFGNAPEVDEYLRRLALARSSYATFLDALRTGSHERGIVVAEFGDHHPVITTPVIEAREGPDALSRFGSSAYETFYAATTIGLAPAAALPRYPVLDLSYLGLSVLELAGLPLGPAYTEQRALRDHCGGAFHTCADRAAVDRYLGRLVGAGLLDLP